MVEVLTEKNPLVIKNSFLAKNIKYNYNSMLIKAVENGNTIGRALFFIENKKLVLQYLEPQKDIMLIDGLIRSVLHYASENLIEEAFYELTAPEELLEKLGFIDNKEDKKLLMLGLIASCENCKNK